MGAGAFRLPRRGRARVAVVASVVAVVACAGLVQMWPAFAAGSPTRPVDTDINKYVLFALNSLDFKGGSVDVAHIKHGDIGVNSAAGALSSCGGGGAGQKVTMDEDGSQGVAANVDMQSNCSIWDLYTNHLTGGSSPVIRTSGRTRSRRSRSSRACRRSRTSRVRRRRTKTRAARFLLVRTAT